MAAADVCVSVSAARMLFAADIALPRSPKPHNLTKVGDPFDTRLTPKHLPWC